MKYVTARMNLKKLIVKTASGPIKCSYFNPYITKKLFLISEYHSQKSNAAKAFHFQLSYAGFIIFFQTTLPTAKNQIS